jgi:tricarballylate dehydrogenase
MPRHDGGGSAVEETDVLVVGTGNAGLSAALAASETGARVLVVESAPRAWAGGNSYFTAGAFRATYDSVADIRHLLDLTDDEAARIDLPRYAAEDLLGDIRRVTQGRADATLAEILANEATDGLTWLRSKGVAFDLLFARQSFEVDGRIRFWGNLTIGARNGGVGLTDAELAAAEREGVRIDYERPVTDLLTEGDRVIGVRTNTAAGPQEYRARSVVLASGGFEADARRRAQFLGPGWDLAKVRGTPFNTGEPLMLALEIGAQPYGHWSGCHAIAWDAAAPPTGDRVLTNRFSRQAYPYGIVVNARGERFVDEGADFRNYTYAKYGAEVLRQPNALAFQLFDQASLPYLSTVDYDTAVASRYEADTIEALATAMGIDPERLTGTVAAYNDAINDARFDPTTKDGKAAIGIEPPKSNWALPLGQPPYVGFAITCGITFTFGGVRIAPTGEVLRADGTPIDGLFAAGEIVGGLFYHNYPGGTGLTSGTVFGRRAGSSAGRATSDESPTSRAGVAAS